MKIDFPTTDLIPQLRTVWKDSFGDTDEFLDSFFSTGFSPSHCRCLTVEDRVAAVLYWFDVSCKGKRMAYLYAVATAPAFREQGLCRRLMKDTHAHLSLRGYSGILLVPDGEALSRMYAGLGYIPCTTIHEFVCAAGDMPIPMHRIDREEYARLRRIYLPENGVVQEEENLLFLEKQASFYTGLGFLLAARQEEDRLRGLELLGNPDAAPGILLALGKPYGTFRIPGEGEPFAMFLPLKENAPVPGYFGLAFD